MSCNCGEKTNEDKEKKCGEIIFHEYSSYIFVECDVETEAGEKIDSDTVRGFCRCGESNSKPYCDGTHSKINFAGKRLKERKHPPKDYIGEKIIIHDSRYMCCHDGACTSNLPEVFKLYERPWIDPNGAEPERIIEVIKKCPSGALSYTFNGERVEDWFNDKEQKIIIMKNGPYHVQGGIEIKDSLESQKTAITQDHYSLCRCGKSKHLPYCDGAHILEGFKD